MAPQDKRIRLRKARSADAADFAELVLMSAPGLFPAIWGDGANDILQYLFLRLRNLFSFEHTIFAESDGARAGMLLGYDRTIMKKEDVRTGLLLMKRMRFGFLFRLPTMLKSERVFGGIRDGEYYVSNLAVFPACRRTGAGTKLLLEAEEEAKRNGMVRMIVDVDADNSGGQSLYRRTGYSVAREATLSLRGGEYAHRIYRMCKELE